jgi:hypothetical protein
MQVVRCSGAVRDDASESKIELSKSSSMDVSGLNNIPRNLLGWKLSVLQGHDEN